MLPRVYLFLICSGGFALLFTYAVIMATHIRFRKKMGCPKGGKCQLPGVPYTSWIVLISMVVIILSMPLIPGQSSGLIAGIIMIALYSSIYFVIKFVKSYKKSTTTNKSFKFNSYKSRLSAEFSKELSDEVNEKDKKGTNKK